MWTNPKTHLHFHHTILISKYMYIYTYIHIAVYVSSLLCSLIHKVGVVTTTLELFAGAHYRTWSRIELSRLWRRNDLRDAVRNNLVSLAFLSWLRTFVALNVFLFLLFFNRWFSTVFCGVKTNCNCIFPLVFSGCYARMVVAAKLMFFLNNQSIINTKFHWNRCSNMTQWKRNR